MSLERKLAVAEIEEILKGRSEEIRDHRVVVALGAEPLHKRHTNTTGEGIADLVLILKLGMLSLDQFGLDSDLFAGNSIDAEVDITRTILGRLVRGVRVGCEPTPYSNRVC
jgi:hypothetical protein